MCPDSCIKIYILETTACLASEGAAFAPCQVLSKVFPQGNPANPEKRGSDGSINIQESLNEFKRYLKKYYDQKIKPPLWGAAVNVEAIVYIAV
jgi:hypothetical protein